MPRERVGRDRERSRPTRWRRFMDALRSNQNFEYLYWLQVWLGCCFDWTMRLLGPLLLLLATGLISTVIGMFFRFILPATAAFGSVRYILHAAWVVFLGVNLFFNYFQCAFTHPGKPELFRPCNVMSDSDDEDTADEEEGSTRPLIAEEAAISRVNMRGSNMSSSINSHTSTADAIHGNGILNSSNISSTNNGSQWSTGSQRNGAGEGGRGSRQAASTGGARGSASGRVLRCGYCKKCQGPKPARAHHCHVCDQCIVNMDHHCPWMNNCVGYLNYRYFVLFLLYMFVGCVYAVLISAPQFMTLATSPGRTRRPPASEASAHSAVMMTFVLSLSVGIAISVLLGWHLYLILTAQTTIDFYQNQTNRARARQWGELWSNPFDVGYKANWHQVFGPQPFLLGLMPSRRLPPAPIVPFFPLEEPDIRHRFSDEGEWTVDDPISTEQIV